MQFEKGREKTGGRQPGTPNKSAKELRQQLQAVIQTSLDELPQTLAALEPIDRAKLLTSLLPYVMPKLNSIELKSEQPDEQPRNNLPPWLTASRPQN